MKTKPIEQITNEDLKQRTFDGIIAYICNKINELIQATNTNTSRIEDLASKGNIKFVRGKK